ncbi:ATP-dependent Clp protease ATP-binding subunit [Mycoplasma zalophi]|uniref:AAA family ATPase n=1 Tax=Mycoplasma zalophi TaxID=191287 RepID=A0ABS6DPZ1_9MOLU|nr:AAA family ATPase [Mycoplasma zalophi]MBU4691008.1 AAA family ATPase [Mycoplasma zalophi]MBU4692213.1 AAA family ATPase [Mycoplasma zalophi]
MDINWQPNEDNKNPLKEYGRNLIELAKDNKLEPVINRDDEIRRLIRILSRKTKNNPVLVGEPGTGKTAIVEGLARKIVEKQVPDELLNKQLWEIDLASMIAGAMYQGQFEQRIKKLMKIVEESNGNIILFIDEIHMLVGTGKNSSNSTMDAANMFKPLMARGALHLIGATTLDEYRQYIESDPALERRMQKVNVFEPSVEDTITILRGIKERYETFHGVKITDSALVSAANLSARYISDRFLPDKAIDLIDEAAATIKTEINSQPEELDKIMQKIARLEMENAALQTEKQTQIIQEKVFENKKTLEVLKSESDILKKQWQKEKTLINQISNYKDQIDQLKNKLTILQNEGNYTEAAKVLYSDIPNLEKKLQEAEQEINNSEKRLIKEDIDEEEIATIVSKWTNIPVNKLLQTQKTKILNLSQSLKNRIKGQEQAIEAVSKVILRSKAGVSDPRHPIGSFLFLGSTGTGKTELARALANDLFDNDEHLIRLDMSEFMEKHSVSKLIGSPPGYVGFEQGGQLTEKIRQNPYSIILFDEAEKAHPDVLNLLLQILDNGSLTDSRGRNINFKNTIIIMTTNIGSNLINKETINDQQIKTELLKFFKPEFINRIDEIVAFNQLSEEIIKEITELELEKLQIRLQKQLNLKIDFTSNVVNLVSSQAYNSEYGARPIKRYIQNQIENLIAYEIMSKTLEEDQYILIDANQYKVFLEVKNSEIN